MGSRPFLRSSSPAGLELFRRLHQAQVALLDEVEEGQAPPGVALGHRDHQPQVGFAQSPAGGFVPGPGPAGQLRFFFSGEQRHPANFFQISFHRVVQCHPLGGEFVLQPADLLLVQRGQVGVLLRHGHAPGLQRRIQRIQPGHIVVFLLHGPADLLGRQGMAAGAGGKTPGQFVRL